MYNRYKQTVTQSLSVNQQIAAVLKVINTRLQESDQLFRNFQASKSIEVGEKAVYMAIALADILDKYFAKTLESADSQTASGIKELQYHFDKIHKLIIQYIATRNVPLLMRILNDLTAMEVFWDGLGYEASGALPVLPQ